MTTVTNVLERYASPLARARDASTERRRSSEEDVTKGYKMLFETVNPMIEGLNTRVGTVEARLTAQESHSRQEVEGLKTQIVQLREQNERLETKLTNVEKVAGLALNRANNHTHRINLKTREYSCYARSGPLAIQPHEVPFMMPLDIYKPTIILVPILESERPT